MAKCTNCGHITTTNKPDGQRFRKAVEQRLEQYGFEPYNTPHKHQAYIAVRKVIALRSGIDGRSGGFMTKAEADASIIALDMVLPDKAR